MFVNRVRSFYCIALFIVLQCWLSALYACSTIIIVSSNTHFSMVHRIESALYTELKTQKRVIHVLSESVKRPEFFEQYHEPCLITTIGSEALATVLSTKTHTPILSTLLRKGVFHQLLKQYGHSLNEPMLPITAIFVDQPFTRQFNLIQALFPHINEKSPIGILLGPQSVADQELLQCIARDRHLQLITTFVNKSENPIAVVDTMLNEAKLLFAIPDINIYNPTTSHGILLTTYHRRAPLIGFSRTYVNSGAMAAVHSTSKQLADQASKTIAAIIEKNQFPAPQYPKEFSVAMNHHVVHSLGLSVADENTIKSRMDKMQETSPL